jgi:large subunit ribosomal protein L24
MSRKTLRIKRDDTVVVIAGKEKGAVGRVLRVFPEDDRVIVEGIRRVKRHQKPVGEQAGAIVEKEASIHVSNVALWSAEQGRRLKVGYSFEGEGDERVKVRVDRKTGTKLAGG